MKPGLALLLAALFDAQKDPASDTKVAVGKLSNQIVIMKIASLMPWVTSSVVAATAVTTTTVVAVVVMVLVTMMVASIAITASMVVATLVPP